MQPITTPFMPTPDDVRFFNERQAIRYARNAGFTVKNDDGKVVATRADVEGSSVLKEDTEKPDRLVWIRN